MKSIRLYVLLHVSTMIIFVRVHEIKIYSLLLRTPTEKSTKTKFDFTRPLIVFPLPSQKINNEIAQWDDFILFSITNPFLLYKYFYIPFFRAFYCYIIYIYLFNYSLVIFNVFTPTSVLFVLRSIFSILKRKPSDDEFSKNSFKRVDFTKNSQWYFPNMDKEKCTVICRHWPKFIGSYILCERSEIYRIFYFA